MYRLLDNRYNKARLDLSQSPVKAVLLISRPLPSGDLAVPHDQNWNQIHRQPAASICDRSRRQAWIILFTPIPSETEQAA